MTILIALVGGAALVALALMIWARTSGPGHTRAISSPRPPEFSHACSENRHADCAGVADVWGFEKGAVIACYCGCHPPEASERAIEAERERQRRNASELKERYPVHVRTRSEWRDWLAGNHARQPAACLFYSEGLQLTFQEATDEALCFGWVPDSLDVTDRSQIFEPRREGSHWEAYHRARYRELVRGGLMTDAGIAVGPDTENPSRS